MLDFNHKATTGERIVQIIDDALLYAQSKVKPRSYLGASRLGVECARALQYEYMHVPVDAGKSFSGQLLRNFEMGHVFESMVVKWLSNAGFSISIFDIDGSQFGFSSLNGRMRGHIDGVVIETPEELDLPCPMLFECKALNGKSWRDLQRHGLAKSKPVYAAQVALYQAYMSKRFEGLADNPAMFGAVNKDTAEIYIELVPFDGERAQQASDKAVNIFRACDAGEILPRVSTDPEFYQCKMCQWQQRCWENIHTQQGETS